MDKVELTWYGSMAYNGGIISLIFKHMIGLVQFAMYCLIAVGAIYIIKLIILKKK